jgi:YidC/Oxa1 family membrane protein insertase
MAKTAPSPRQNFIQSLLFASVVFLGMQAFCKPPADTTVGKTTEQLYTEVISKNKEINDVTIVQAASAYISKLDADLKAKKIDQAFFDKKKYETAILVSDTQLKAAIARAETGRYRNAYHTLDQLNAAKRDTPEWKVPVAVADVTGDKRFGWKEWTGESLRSRIEKDLSERNKHELTWGFLPGGYQIIDALVTFTGAQPAFSYAFAAFLLALLVRAAVYPLAQKQLMWSRQMQQLQPLATEIREQYKTDPQQQNVKLMELYREYGINPLSGCGPALIQMPLFFTVYQWMLQYQLEFHKGTFLWINPETHRNFKFTGRDLGELDFILIIFYGISMVVTTLLSPVSDPSQAKQQRMIGIGFALFATVTLFTGAFPVAGAFVLYWTFTNILATIQSLRAYRMSVPPLEKVNAAGGGVFPLDPSKFGGNGKTNGKVDPGNTRTGTPAKHKPKKRK